MRSTLERDGVERVKLRAALRNIAKGGGLFGGRIGDAKAAATRAAGRKGQRDKFQCSVRRHRHLSSLMSYFPITFTPPPHDPHQITSQHLLQALLHALKASGLFAAHALPFLVASTVPS